MKICPYSTENEIILALPDPKKCYQCKKENYEPCSIYKEQKETEAFDKETSNLFRELNGLEKKSQTLTFE